MRKCIQIEGVINRLMKMSIIHCLRLPFTNESFNYETGTLFFIYNTLHRALGATETLMMLIGTEASVFHNRIYNKIFSAGHLLCQNSAGEQKGLQESVRSR